MRNLARRSSAAFTLVEVLAVVALVSVLLTVGVLATKGSWRSQEVRAAALKLSHDLTRASQLAMRDNKSVWVYFYRYSDDKVVHPQPQFRAYQLARLDFQNLSTGTGTSPTGKFEFLSEREVFEGHTILVSYVQLTSVAKYMVDDKAMIIEFRPDGSTSLPTADEPWTLTLVSSDWLDTQETPPKNYQTLTINPNTSAVRIYETTAR